MSTATVPIPAAAALALSDEEVVRRVRDGEPALFEILMRRHNQRLYRVARAILRNEDEAEDVMQQAYVSAYAHLDQFAGRARFATWLTRIAAYEAFARRRRRARHAEMEAMEQRREAAGAVREPDPERQAYAGELRRALEAALDAIPATYRTVFVLREVEGLSTADTAGCLGITEENAKTRLHRARSLLRDELFARAGLAAGDVFLFGGGRCDRVVAGVLGRLGLSAFSGR